MEFSIYDRISPKAFRFLYYNFPKSLVIKYDVLLYTQTTKAWRHWRRAICRSSSMPLLGTKIKSSDNAMSFLPKRKVCTDWFLEAWTGSSSFKISRTLRYSWKVTLLTFFVQLNTREYIPRLFKRTLSDFNKLLLLLLGLYIHRIPLHGTKTSSDVLAVGSYQVSRGQ